MHFGRAIRRSLCTVLCPLVLAGSLQGQNRTRLRISVLEGEDAIHRVRASSPVDLRVRVEDEQGRGVPNVPVTFSLPASGAGGTFGGSGSTTTVTTDSSGQAAAQGFRPNGVEGRFAVRITAAYRNATARRIVMQTNAVPERKNSSKKYLWIAAIVAGAVVAGTLLINAVKGSSDPAGGPFGR
jgi:hypothetical protein